MMIKSRSKGNIQCLNLYFGSKNITSKYIKEKLAEIK